jgi:uncharacterized membrane protein
MTDETRFSKVRIEILCDGVFAIAMTLLVLELKVPDLPKTATSSDIWRALAEHGVSFFAFTLTFMLAGIFWMIHHTFFHYLKHATASLAVLSLVFLMFVSLLPFSASMFATYGPRQSAAMVFYLGNQFVLASLMAAQWMVARRGQLLTGDATDPRRRRFAARIATMPVFLGVMLILALVNPAWMAWAPIAGFVAVRLGRRFADRRAALTATSGRMES